MTTDTDPQLEQISADAEAGDATAQFILGGMYENGDGVAEDLTLARHWYEKAAAQGFADAQFNLGVMYENGNGVAKDLRIGVMRDHQWTHHASQHDVFSGDWLWQPVARG